VIVMMTEGIKMTR